MQTFLPYADFKLSAQCLDSKRLNKQISESRQIWHNVVGLNSGWINHPAVRMWFGFEDALRLYIFECHSEWVRRGGKPHTFKLKEGEKNFDQDLNQDAEMPNWFNSEIHITHQSNLLRKDSKYYSKFFQVSPCLPYFWPRSKYVRRNVKTCSRAMFVGPEIG